MASIRATASSFQAKMQGLAGAWPSLPPEASLWATCPTLEISCQVHKVPGTVSVELDAFPAVQRTARFPGDHTAEQVSHPGKGGVHREEPGPWGQDREPATVPCQVERVWVGGTHAHGPLLPWGVRPALCPGD